MLSRVRRITWAGIVILLLVGVVGYTQGWLGQIFGVALKSDYTATIDGSTFSTEGTFDKVIIRDGGLELERLNEG